VERRGADISPSAAAPSNVYSQGRTSDFDPGNLRAAGELQEGSCLVAEGSPRAGTRCPPNASALVGDARGLLMPAGANRRRRSVPPAGARPDAPSRRSGG
jgi:hypothetical protein